MDYVGVSTMLLGVVSLTLGCVLAFIRCSNNLNQAFVVLTYATTVGYLVSINVA